MCIIIYCRHEYYLNDYITKIGNYSIDQMKSSLQPELWFDGFNYDKSDIEAKQLDKLAIENHRQKVFPSSTLEGVVYYRYDFCFIPDFGFLGSSEPLSKNVELKLNFDREIGKMSVIDFKSEASADHSKTGDPWKIKDCFAVTEYVSSPDLRAHYESINGSPLVYSYDENEVMIRSLPLNETNIRLDAIHGGPIPSYLFAGVIESDSLGGKLEKSCTGFKQHGVVECNININGHSVNGYPIKCDEDVVTYPLEKWLDSTNRLHNNLCGQTLSLESFKNNFIWSHYFESEETSTGWISIDLKLEKGYDTNMSLVVWLISPYTLTLDKFNQIERIKV